MGNKYEGIGIKCDIFSAKNEIEHMHRNIELDFVIEGQIKVVVDENEFDIQPEELILIDSNKKHYVYVKDEALICRIEISYEMLLDMTGEEYIFFLCNILTDKDAGYSEIRDIILKIISIQLENQKKEAFLLMEQYGRLLNCFIKFYRINLPGERDSAISNDTDRIREILNYINMNYQEPISLVSLSEQMFVSVSTLSRMFRKATGAKFPDYINQVRMHYAVSDLLNSNKSITEIAVDNGFSSPSSFNRVFKEIYGTTPSQYKKSVRNTYEKENAKLTESEQMQVRQYLDDNLIQKEDDDQMTVIRLQLAENDADAGELFQNISTKAVNLGAFNNLVSASVQQQVRQMVSQLKLQYFRVWNIFSPKCMIAASPEDKQLSFEQVDVALDFLVSIHVRPFFDMTDHPEVVIKNTRELSYRKEDSMGFKNLEQWSYFLDRLMNHIVFRYGEEEVSNWIFEFCNLPSASNFAYYENNIYADVFRESYKIIKGYCPSAKVGGPNWILDGCRPEIESYFDDWKSMGIYPDFYSVCIFPYVHGNGNNDSRDIYGYEYINERNMDPDFMNDQIHLIHEKLKQINAPERPLYVSETSTILSNRNAMNDHCGRGTNVLRITNQFQNYTDMICFWVATDRLSLRYAPQGVLHGGSGLMSKDGIPKPSYYALYFLAKMDGKLLGKGPGYIAVENSPNSIYIVCYNHKNLIENYKYAEADSVNINVHNVDQMFDNRSGLTLKFIVKGLEPDAEYVIKKHVVNQEYGSVMDEWKRLGFETEMRSNDIDYLKSVCVPRIQMKRRTAQQGQIVLEARLLAHEMQLLHIYK